MSATPDKTAKELAYEKFENVFKDTLVDQILAHAKKCKLPQDYQDWFEKVSSIHSRLFHILTIPCFGLHTEIFLFFFFLRLAFFFWGPFISATGRCK